MKAVKAASVGVLAAVALAACGTTSPLLRTEELNQAGGTVDTSAGGGTTGTTDQAGTPAQGGTDGVGTTAVSGGAPADAGGSSSGSGGGTTSTTTATAGGGGTAGGTAGSGGSTGRTTTTAKGGKSTAAPTNSAGKTTVTATPGAVATKIPDTGKGWTKTTATVAIITAKDASSAIHALGVNIDPGDEEGDAQAIVAGINKRGGLFGRQVVLYDLDNSSASVLANASSVAQSDCTALTQDRQVLAVINTDASLDLDSARGCFAKAQTPFVTLSTNPIDDTTAAAYTPYFYNGLVASYSTLAQTWVDQLNAQNFFSGWNTATGNASTTAKTVVGIIGANDASSDRAIKAVAADIGKLGFQTVTYESANESGDGNAEVLKMQGSGVTHLLSVDAGLFYFLTTANNQHFYPRLGVNTYNGLQALIGADPEQQLNGSIGLGWNPSLDVNAPQDPGVVGPGEAQCLSDLAAGGQTFAGKQFARAYGLAVCDGINLAVLGAKTGGGMDPASIRRGIVSLGTNFPVGGSFGSGLSATNFGLPGAGKVLQYTNSCKCYAYTGNVVPFQ